MPMTFLEAQQQLESYRYELAVWSDVVSYLSTMLTFETHQAEKKIMTDDGMLAVPEPVIEHTIESITKERIEPLNEQISAFAKLSVADLNNEETNEQDTEEGGKGKSEKAQKEGGQAGPVQKRVRAAIRRPG